MSHFFKSLHDLIGLYEEMPDVTFFSSGFTKNNSFHSHYVDGVLDYHINTNTCIMDNLIELNDSSQMSCLDVSVITPGYSPIIHYSDADREVGTFGDFDTWKFSIFCRYNYPNQPLLQENFCPSFIGRQLDWGSGGISNCHQSSKYKVPGSQGGKINFENLVIIVEGCKNLVYLDVSDCIGFDADDEKVLELASHIKTFKCEGSMLEEDYYEDYNDYEDFSGYSSP
ncbi:unnamed protein product [Dovyalis caffra]|uniref:Uncharacterized protein n=1 Tax=Dovyalis caffra TaxID=77055 RepID=A0AAV1RUE4_9ROSI|nr:unnamed protein product [Dovyalis caffra]